MGRGRVEVKRIENKLNRQVTFAKRRNGILKKAYELSVLCDAEVALVVFSTSGKLYEYCSSPSMLKTIDRYQKCSYGLEASQPVNENQQNCYHEYLRLKARVDVLQQSQRNLLGQDLGTLNTNELEQLELQVEMSLKQIRSRKTRFMLDEIADLQRREQMLAEANRVLRRKMEESATEFPLRLSWEAGGHQNIPHNHQSAQLEGFFPPLGLNSTLQMGYNPVDSEGHMHVSAPSHHHSHGFFPEWMP